MLATPAAAIPDSEVEAAEVAGFKGALGPSMKDSVPLLPFESCLTKGPTPDSHFAEVIVLDLSTAGFKRLVEFQEAVDATEKVAPPPSARGTPVAHSGLPLGTLSA